MKKITLALLVAGAALSACTQKKSMENHVEGNIFETYERFLTEPYGYVANKAAGEIKVDGILDEADWQNAPFTEDFADISGEGFPTPRFKTNAKMLWDDNYLYIGAELEEPSIWADLVQRDTIVYYNHDFEVFVDPDGDGQNYFEVETNARETIFDLFIQKPYRALTRAFVTFAWDCPGLKLKTHLNGTMNNPNDEDKGWSVEIAIPREAIAAEFDNYLQAGNYLRVGFSRVEWQTELDETGAIRRKKGEDGKFLPEDNWTWPSTGMIAMHMPERWGYVYLADKAGEKFQMPAYRPVERLLWAMFYEQEKQMEKNGAYLSCPKCFNLPADEVAKLPAGSDIKVEATANHFEITVTAADGSSMSIDQNGYVCKREAKK